MKLAVFIVLLTIEGLSLLAKIGQIGKPPRAVDAGNVMTRVIGAVLFTLGVVYLYVH